ncbi:MAG: EF-P lysine aminoacylase EpmA [bacterium]
MDSCGYADRRICREGNKKIERRDIFFLRHELLKSIRSFFYKRNYIEVQTPHVVLSPGIDPHIEAVCVEGGYYLITSPELHMKRVVSMGCEKIFQITHAFRKEESGTYHNPEFCILEWYIINKEYTHLMKEVLDLVQWISQDISYASSLSLNHVPRISIDDLFITHAGWKPSSSWDEMRFFSDFVDKIEPALKEYEAVIIYDFPSPLASLSRIKDSDPLFCERFELYLRGFEIANGFTELTDAEEYRTRFKEANRQRKTTGKKEYPVDESFLSDIQSGFPSCAGIALGVDRLLMAIIQASSIGEVMPFAQYR